MHHTGEQERASGDARLRSRKTAGILLVIFPTVIYGGISLLTFLIDRAAGYVDNPIRQDLFRAGHAHAGVFLVLSLIVLRYVDEARLSQAWKQFVRSSVPSAAILVPTGFFFSVLSPSATSPNRLIYLSFAGAVLLAAGLITLGIGLLRSQSET
jgi:drug/metabolite transporter superfamily protein YnfA